MSEGLNSLKETEEKVFELKKDLAKFNEELELKNKEAAEKLELIIKKKKEASLNIENSKKLSEQGT